jgi:prepilin-type N-terminal cleavage/methylation domain-containing protein
MLILQKSLEPNTPRFHHVKAGSAFTLIELLVVIAIIAILAGLALPAMQGALNSGKKAQARNDVQQIAAAIRAFELEYGRQPDAETSSDKWISDNSSLMKALLGEDTTLNPKGIRFLDVKTTPGTKGGVNDSSRIFYDPWGQPYFIKLNTDYDNKIDHYGTQFISVIVHSSGPDKAMGKGDKIEGSDDVVNFK